MKWMLRKKRESEFKEKKIQSRSKMVVQLATVIVFIIAVTVTTIGTMNYRSDIQKMLDNKKEANKIMAKVVAQQADMYVTSSLDILNTVVATTDFGALDDYEKDITLSKVASKNVQFKSVYMTDMDGNVTSTTNARRDDGKNYKGTEWFKAAVGGKTYFSDTFIDEDSKMPIIIVAIPIENMVTGQTGVMAADLRLDRLFYLTKDMKIGETGYSYIVDKQGNIIAHPQFKEKVLTKYNALEKGIKGVTSVVEGKSDVEIYEDTEGRKVVGGYAPVSSTHWGVLVEQQYSEVTAQGKAALMRVMGISCIVILLSVAVTTFFAKAFTKPITDMLRVVDRIKAGDLTERVPVSATNEVGLLQEAFNDMTQSLSQLIQDVNRASKKINHSVIDLEKNAMLTAEATDEIIAAIDEVAIGTEKQMHSVENSTQVVSQMIAGVRSVSDHAGEILKSSAYASELAQHGAKGIEEMIRTMGSIDDTVGKSAKIIKELSDHTYQIHDIVQLIKQISDQTNLLALNAAIEAARAGEHGRGFSVVADEVRKLAEQSAKASGNIVELIKRIEQETDRAVKTMEYSLDGVRNGTKAVSGTTQSFHEIIEETRKVAHEVESFTAAIEELTAGMDLVEQSMVEVNHVSQTTASSAQVVLASTEEQEGAIREMTESIQGLSQMAHSLEGFIQRFNTEQGQEEKIVIEEMPILEEALDFEGETAMIAEEIYAEDVSVVEELEERLSEEAAMTLDEAYDEIHLKDEEELEEEMEKGA